MPHITFHFNTYFVINATSWIEVNDFPLGPEYFFKAVLITLSKRQNISINKMKSLSPNIYLNTNCKQNQDFYVCFTHLFEFKKKKDSLISTPCIFTETILTSSFESSGSLHLQNQREEKLLSKTVWQKVLLH